LAPASTERCRLEPDGTLLTTGRCWFGSGRRRHFAVLHDWEQPGRVVKRCLLEHLRDIAIELNGGGVLQGRVERVRFDPSQGRVCTARLEQR